MQTVTLVLLALLALDALFMLLSPMTRACWERVRDHKARESAFRAAAKPVVPPPVLASAPRPVLPDIPAEETAAFYVRRVLSSRGVLGLLFIPVLVAFFPMNTRILAENFANFLNKAPSVLVTAAFREWRWDVTDMEVFGMTISLALVLLAAAHSAYLETRSRARWFLLFFALAPVVLFEVGLAAKQGLDVADGTLPAYLAAAGALQAWICASTEVIAGHFSIHQAVVPILQCVGWMAIAPVRWLVRVVRHRRLARPIKTSVDRKPETPGALTRLAGYVDEALLAPLRRLDAGVAARLRDRFAGKGVADVC